MPKRVSERSLTFTVPLITSTLSPVMNLVETTVVGVGVTVGVGEGAVTLPTESTKEVDFVREPAVPFMLIV